MKHKILASVLSVFMAFSVLPVKVNAESRVEETVTVFEDAFVSASVNNVDAGARISIEPGVGEDAEVLYGTYGYLDYTISNGEVTITGCNRSATSVDIPEVIEGCPVTAIGERAFYEFTDLSSVTVSKSVKRIEDWAFSKCSNLTKLIMPGNVADIGYAVFFGCNALKTAGPVGGEYNYEFEWKDSIPAHAFEGCIGLTSVTLPDSITSIGDDAFRQCNFKTITLPDGVSSIGSEAFSACSSLTSIAIPHSVTSIGDSAFSHCRNLAGVTVPDSITSIGKMVFEGCVNFKTAGPIGGGYDYEFGWKNNIPANAFYYCENLTGITLPDSVTSIGEYAFYYCTGLTGITLPDKVAKIDKGTFQNCSGLSNITIPDSVISIGDYAFYNCSSLTNVSFGKGVKNIGGRAFYRDISLTDITIPNGVTSIGEEAFIYCTGLSSVTIPNSITGMGNNSFVGCTNLTSVTLEDGLTIIGNGTFQGCSSLSSITIPDSVTDAGAFTFSNCTGLASIIIPGNISYDSTTFRGCNSLKTAGPVGSEANIQISGSGVLNICFSMFPGLVSVNIPNTFTELRSSVFKNCENLTEVIIPDGVTSIGSSAFGNCTSLTHLSIPDSVTEIGERSFSGCSNLTSVNIPEGVTSISDVLFDRCTSLKSITIPNGVKSIGIDSFSWCSALTSITIPNSVESLDLEAFYCCLGLTSIVIGNGVKKIDDRAFFLDDKVKYVFYVGTNTQWKKIKIGKNNECLSKVIFCPNYYQVKPFVERLYKLCFNRDADAGGLNNWMYYLLTGKKTAAQIVQSFFTSKEMQNLKLSDEEIVERCYQVMMNRASDAGGKKGWLEKLNAGVSLNYVLKGFVGSAEFAKICKNYGITVGTITLTEARDQNLGITQFVSRCYSEVLGRKADVGGLNNWCGKILNAANKKQAAIDMASNGFFHSREYLNKNTTDDEYVRTLYRTFLGREADTGGYNGWMKKLASGTSRDTVLMGFANSAEFASIMAKYGIK